MFKYNAVMNHAWVFSSADVNEMLLAVFFFPLSTPHHSSIIPILSLCSCVNSNVESGIFSAAVWQHHLQKGEELRPGFYAREHR